MRCAECGGEMALVSSPLTETLKDEEYTVYGISRYQCRDCGEYEIDPAEERRLSDELWRMHRQRYGILSPQEISALRSAMGLSQAEFGRLVGANVQTISRWENGRVIPDIRANKLMVLLRDVPPAAAALCEMAEVRTGSSVAISTGTAEAAASFTVNVTRPTVTVGSSNAPRPTIGGRALNLGKAVA